MIGDPSLTSCCLMSHCQGGRRGFESRFSRATNRVSRCDDPDALFPHASRRSSHPARSGTRSPRLRELSPIRLASTGSGAVVQPGAILKRFLARWRRIWRAVAIFDDPADRGAPLHLLRCRKSKVSAPASPQVACWPEIERSTMSSWTLALPREVVGNVRRMHLGVSFRSQPSAFATARNGLSSDERERIPPVSEEEEDRRSFIGPSGIAATCARRTLLSALGEAGCRGRSCSWSGS